MSLGKTWLGAAIASWTRLSTGKTLNLWCDRSLSVQSRFVFGLDAYPNMLHFFFLFSLASGTFVVDSKSLWRMSEYKKESVLNPPPPPPSELISVFRYKRHGDHIQYPTSCGEGVAKHVPVDAQERVLCKAQVSDLGEWRHVCRIMDNEMKTDWPGTWSS